MQWKITIGGTGEFGFGGVPAMPAWPLAAVHLAMTLVAKFPVGLVRRLAFALHGRVERIVDPALIAIAFFPTY
ncbi:MAG: hypothetical protein WBO09_21850 [Methylocystis silviterrae]